MNLDKSLFAGSPYNVYGLFTFRKGGEIGNGSYGNVRQAELNGTVFAIKKIKVNAKFPIRYILREVEALIKLDGCANVVQQ
ncbi:hypothetical protein B4U80_11447 [Leptotrombidium deliense]|uniref:Protein kinase domain-containing protein n=1 Tax=Leptotrombidium deliense TaxID=299467 RepID=A0A443RX53_9ACAR|nr:hypothetical protein B4U80_11447 [Leptotrombidium deliense]